MIASMNNECDNELVLPRDLVFLLVIELVSSCVCVCKHTIHIVGLEKELLSAHGTQQPAKHPKHSTSIVFSETTVSPKAMYNLRILQFHFKFYNSTALSKIRTPPSPHELSSFYLVRMCLSFLDE